MIRTATYFEAMRSIDLGDQFFRNRLPLCIGSAIGALGIAGICVLASVTGSDLSELTRDVVAVVDTHLYTGALSTTGLMLWAAAAAICLLAASLVGRMAQHRSSMWFLLCAGALTTLLGFDDAFLLHERVFPTYLGLPQKGVYAVYIGMITAFLVGFMPSILKTDYVILAASLVFMALSVGMDEFLVYSRFETFVEDSCKFVGIVFWLTYFAWTSSRLIRRSLQGI
ncbi:MAG: hypothetical protein HRU01_09415 [Myxococcales bacterium]|nr:hypothetical protein [Myxococcales bacterium]